MSYLLEFPPGPPLPEKVHSPPYVLFGIQGVEVFGNLPTNIPLALVLHFAPKLKRWVLPAPELPPSAAQMSLRTPYIGINILENISLGGLIWIVSRMMQMAGLPVDKEMFRMHPNIMLSIAIHKTWVALGLPVSGLQALHTHIATRLMFVGPVSIAEIKAIWNTFPNDSLIVHEMGMNFIRSHIDFQYNREEFSSIRHWYLDSRRRTRFFKGLESQLPEFDKVQDSVIEAVTEAQKAATSAKAASEAAKKDMVTEKKTIKVSSEEKRARRKKEMAELIERSKRVRRASTESANSVDTAIWDPQDRLDETKAKWNGKNAADAVPRSQPADGTILAEMLEELAMERRTQRELEAALNAPNKKIDQQQDPGSDTLPGTRALETRKRTTISNDHRDVSR